MKGKNMATNVNPTPGVEVEKVEKTYKYIDLATMSEARKTVQIEFSPAKTIEDAMARLNDQEQLLTAVNDRLRKLTFVSARKEAIAGGASKGIVMGIARTFRAFPQFAKLLVVGENGKATVESKRAQTKAILEAFSKMPEMIAMLQSASAAVENDEDEGDDDE